MCLSVCFQDEGVKQFERFVDFKGCSVTPLSGKKRYMYMYVVYVHVCVIHVHS